MRSLTPDADVRLAASNDMNKVSRLKVPTLVPPSLLASIRAVTIGRVVEVWGADPEPCSIALAGTEVRAWEAGQIIPANLLLCPDLTRAAEFIADPVTAAAAAAGMLVVCWSVAAPLMPTAAYARSYLHRQVAGALLRDIRFRGSRVTVLHEHLADREPDLHLLLWSDQPIPELAPGLYEAGCEISLVPTALSVAAGPRKRIESDTRAIALVCRLLKVEERTVALRGEIRRLKGQLAEQVGPSPGGAFDFPRTQVPWPFAEAEDENSLLSLYDRRPEDSALVEARRGAAFFEKYDFLGDIPDFSAATAELNTCERVLRIVEPSPNVSIIIPVYGQLPYTLNALHSLITHASRFTAEIIVVDDCSPDGVTAEFVPQVTGVRYHRQPKNGGFIQSCNTGGKLARGEYVILLNSDTRVVEGWLDEMISSFDLFPRAGLVGSKLLYPDGALQEAGGILWRDGSAWNYGRDDDPNRPQYCFARQVDYISGASIAVRSTLWRDLGGFDLFYTPAYAEDADVCQRIRARGLEVWLQPASRIIHYEGKTSGTSTSGGAKAYQLINLRKLFLRWRKEFELHRRNADAPFFEKERSVQKRILFVDAVTPTPDQDAGSVQTVLGLRCAQLAGFKAHFVPEDNWLFEPDYTRRLQREGVECAYAPFDVGFEDYIRRYGWLFDAVVVYRVHVMQKCLPLLQDHAPEAVLLFHVADLHFLRLQRYAELEGDADAMRAALALKEEELDIVRRSHCTITHSTVEAEILGDEVPDASVTVWPLMMEPTGTKVGFEPRRDICFLGGYRHTPNVDAVLFFVREVLPLIRAVRPEIKFIIAGANPTPEVQHLACDSVVVTGMVEDLAGVFDAARVFVCPLRVGAGAKGKIMSALAHGLPIVSTPIGVEGAGLTEGKHMLVADGPAELAAAVLRLYDDQVLWQQLSAAGEDLISREFSLGMGVQKLEEAIEKAYRKRLGLIEA